MYQQLFLLLEQFKMLQKSNLTRPFCCLVLGPLIPDLLRWLVRLVFFTNWDPVFSPVAALLDFVSSSVVWSLVWSVCFVHSLVVAVVTLVVVFLSSVPCLLLSFVCLCFKACMFLLSALPSLITALCFLMIGHIILYLFACFCLPPSLTPLSPSLPSPRPAPSCHIYSPPPPPTSFSRPTTFLPRPITTILPRPTTTILPRSTTTILPRSTTTILPRPTTTILPRPTTTVLPRPTTIILSQPPPPPPSPAPAAPAAPAAPPSPTSPAAPPFHITENGGSARSCLRRGRKGFTTWYYARSSFLSPWAKHPKPFTRRRRSTWSITFLSAPLPPPTTAMDVDILPLASTVTNTTTNISPLPTQPASNFSFVSPFVSPSVIPQCLSPVISSPPDSPQPLLPVPPPPPSSTARPRYQFQRSLSSSSIPNLTLPNSPPPPPTDLFYDSDDECSSYSE